MTKRSALSLGTVMVLHAIARGKQYGFDIIEATGLTSGTIYPALDRLQQLGYANSKWEDPTAAQREKRPQRRYYSITAPGREVLDEALQRYRSLAPLDADGHPQPRTG